VGVLSPQPCWIESGGEARKGERGEHLKMNEGRHHSLERTESAGIGTVRTE